MAMYNLIEYSDKYSKTSGSTSGNTSGNTKDVEIIVPLKYLSNFQRTLEMSMNKCEVNLILTQSSTCVITNSTGAERFAITDTKLYVPVVILSSKSRNKPLQSNFQFSKTFVINK